MLQWGYSMKNHLAKRTLAIGIFLLFCCTGLYSPLLQAQSSSRSMTVTDQCSAPTTTLENGMLHVSLTQATGITSEFGKPQLPVVTSVYELPRGTQIRSVTFTPGIVQTMCLNAPVQPVPTPQKIGDLLVPYTTCDETVYNAADPYPTSWGWYTLGAGINSSNEHVLFLSLHATPVRYRPALGELQYTTAVTMTVSYDTPPATAPVTTTYGLVIIAPEEFKDALQPLVDHKTSHGLPTTVVTLEDIAATYTGRDLQEKIKYCIKDAIETWGTSYVLLVGDIKTLPIRTTYSSWWEADILSDLYYADIYNAQDQFCSWDKNNNSRFGETNYDGADLDGVDLYPDVNVGRLACSNVTDVQTQVDKIITYEMQTYNQTWFKHIGTGRWGHVPAQQGRAA